MSERSLRLATAALALAGAAVATYLLVVRATGSSLVCSTGGCEAVQSSPYAELAGVPVALLGLIGFLDDARPGRSAAARPLASPEPSSR